MAKMKGEGGMTTIDARQLDFRGLNERIRSCRDDHVKIAHCLGQRYIGSGLSDKRLTVEGTPGNALGAYLDGAAIEVHGNAQDATGDTMNGGLICIHGSSGDATGYAMRGGVILVEGNTGYRAGIHMKEYEDKRPVLVIGGEAGSFLGEYQAGGIIVVLGLQSDGRAPVGNFCGTGMHGGRIFLRCVSPPENLPPQLKVSPASAEDMQDIEESLDAFCRIFEKDKDEVLSCGFYVLSPNSKNPYKRLYTST